VRISIWLVVFAFFFGMEPAASSSAVSASPSKLSHVPVQLVLTPENAEQFRQSDGSYVLGDMVFSETSVRGGFQGAKWPGGLVYYYFAPEIDDLRKARFRTAANAWASVAGLQFIESGTAANRIRVQLSVGGDFCNSMVGMTGMVDQPLNLGSSLNSSCWSNGTIVHELGHALGLLHEQSRAERDAFVQIALTGGGSSACNALIIANYGLFPTQSVTAYDFASIMHYPSFLQLDSVGCPTGVTGVITALVAQPAGAPVGSADVCNTPAACTQLMGRTQLSLRDGFSMARRYGYRIEVIATGRGTGTFTVAGQIENCGANCFLASPDSSLNVVANPASDSIFTGFSGACVGDSCSLLANANGTINVRFLEKRVLAIVPTIANTPTTATIPNAPTGVIATSGNAQVSVGFTTPASNGGSPITSYTATCGSQNASGAAAAPIVVSGLTNGVAVTCMVIATNAVGNSVPSASSNSVTPGGDSIFKNGFEDALRSLISRTESLIVIPGDSE